MSNIYLASRDGANQFLTKAQADQLYATSGAVNGKLDLTGGSIRPTTNSTSTFRVLTQTGLARLTVDTTGNNGGVQTLGGYTALDTFQTSIRPAGGQFFVSNSAGTTQVLTIDSALGATTFQTAADSANAFRVNTRTGGFLFGIDNTVGNSSIGMSTTNLNLNGSFTSIRPSGGGSFRVRNQTDTATWTTISGADGSTTFQNSTDGANAFRVLDAAANPLLSVNSSAKSVTYGNGSTGTFASPSANGIQMDAFGSLAFKSTALNSNQWIVQTTGGGVPFSIDNKTTAGGSGVYTFNHTLDNGTGSAIFKTSTNSTTGFQVQNNASNRIFTVNTNGNVVQVPRVQSVNIGGNVPGFTLSGRTGAGTGATGAVQGTDTCGELRVTTGTSPASNASVFGFVFSSAGPNAPKSIQLTPAFNRRTNQELCYVADLSSTGFDIYSTSALSPSTTYEWFYTVIF
jgi:hypothetical protein